MTHRGPKQSRTAPSAPSLAPWTSFERARPIPLSDEKLARLSRQTGKTPDEVRRLVAHDQHGAEYWQNSRYLVIKNRERRKDGLGWVWHLSFRRLDRLAVGPEHFRDFQRIKNALLGAEATAFEVYPAESNLADTSNQYHLWAYDDLRAFPFGFIGRAVLDDDGDGTQRPLSED